MRFTAFVALLTLAAGCPAPVNMCVDNCDDGGAGGGTAGSGGGTAGTGGGTSGTGGGGACTESWTCRYWQSAHDGGAERTCFDTNACGTTATRPAVTAPLPALNLPSYQCNVQPVLAKSCAMVACHGNLDPNARPFQVFARGRQRNDEIITYDQGLAGCLQSGVVAININHVGTGTASCNAKARLSTNEWAYSFDSARALMIGVATVDQSELLDQPRAGSGFAHAGIKLWTSSSADYQTVRAWLLGGTAAATCNAATNN